MFAVPDTILNATVYLYPSTEAAVEGRASGGSGFVVGVRSALLPRSYLYVVTNRHVVDSGSRVVRVNTTADGTDFIVSDVGDWTIGLEDDLAILPFEVRANFQWSYFTTDMFLGEDCIIEEHAVQVGDHAILIGRLVNHEGRQRNKPVGRFGNVAMLADAGEPIRLGDTDQEAFLVECRSLSGFSGSPVLVYLADTRMRSTPGEPMRRISRAPKLLGIDCGHLPAWAPVCGDKSRDRRMADMWVETNSGIAVVIPAWRLLRLLNGEHLSGERARLDAEAP